VLEWILGYGAAKALDAVLSATWGPTLNRTLLQEISQWREALPSELSLGSETALFPVHKPDEALPDQPSLLELRSKIGSSEMPSVELWHRALMEQWRSVRKLEGELQPFFECDEETASSQLQFLAARLQKTCEQQPELFQPETLALLRKYGVVLSTLSQQLEAIDDKQGKTLASHARLEERIMRGFEAMPHEINAFLDARLSQFEAKMTAPRTNADEAVASAVDKQIDDYVDLMARDPKTSLNLLEQLQKRFDSTTTDRIRYRVRANIAACHFTIGNENEAADGFISAYELDPSHRTAASNKALGLLIRKDIEELKTFALGILRDHPENAAVAGFLVQGLIDDASTDDPLAIIPAAAQKRPEFKLSYLHWLMDRGAPGSWRDFAKSEYDSNQSTEGIAEYYANALIDEVLENSGFETGHILTPQDKENLEIAAEIYEQSWKEFRASDKYVTGEPISTPFNLMLAYRLLNRGEDAIRVGKEALDRFPTNNDLMQRTAAALMESGNNSEARELVQSLPHNVDTVMMRLNLFLGTEQWNEVDELVSNHMELFPAQEQAMARAAQVIANLERAKVEDRPSILESYFGKDEDDARVCMLLAQSARHNGLSDLSDRYFQAGLDLLQSGKVHFADRISIAKEAVERAEPSVAARALYGHVSCGHDSAELRLLARAISHEYPIRERAQKFFASLTPNIRSLAFYARMEGIYNINRGMPRLAVGLFRSSFDKDQKLADLMGLIAASLRSGKNDDIKTLLEDDKLDNLTGDLLDKINYCHVLLDFGFSDRALQLGYSTVLRGLDQADVVMKFLGLVIKPTAKPKLPETLYVDIGSWVLLKDENGSEYSGLVGEDADRPWGQAIPKDNTFIAKAIGLKAGSTFEYEATFGIVQKWTIEEIKPNWLQAVHVLSHTFNQRFPEARGFGSITMKDGDIEPTLAQVRRFSEARREQADLHTVHGVPIAFAAGDGPGASIGFAQFIAEIGRDIKTCAGTQPERAAALKAIEENKKNGAVLDALTAWTVSALELFDILEDQLGPLLISSSELDQIRSIVADAEDQPKGEQMSLSYNNGNFYRTIVSEEERAANLEALKSRLKRIEDACTVETVALPDNLPEEAEKLASIASGNVLVPIVQAGNDRLLLSEDLALRQLASAIFGTKGIWLQAALLRAYDNAAMTLEQYSAALVQLSARHHNFVSVSADTLHTTFLSDDSDTLVRLQALARYVGTRSAEPLSHINLAADFINIIWSSAAAEDLRTCRATSIILRALITRHRGEAWNKWAAATYAILDARPKAYFTSWCRGHFLPLSEIQKELNARNKPTKN